MFSFKNALAKLPRIFSPSCFTLFGAACLASHFALTAHAFDLFESKDKAASVKAVNGGVFSGQSKIAIGAFRVAFVTEDAANSESHGVFAGDGSAARMSGKLLGLDHALMQKITDEVYADFLKQAAAKGYTVMDSTALAQTSPAYNALVPAENFMTGRLGTFVIPTGQRSMVLGADSRAKDEKGSSGLGAAWHNMTDQVVAAPASKAFPVVAKEAGMPVMGVTIVANFANFKGTSSSFGSSKATIALGATIDGHNKNNLIASTSVQGWNAGTGSCALCMAQFNLEGQIHSDVSIGTMDTHGEWSIGNVSKKGAVVQLDSAAYETNVVLVASQASDLMLSAMAAKK